MGAQPLQPDPAHPGSTLPRACDQDSQFVDVPHQGPSCWNGKAFLVRTRNGTVTTHGADVRAATSVAPASTSPLYAGSSATACTQSRTGPNHFEIVYAHPTDRADLVVAQAPLLRQLVFQDDYALRFESSAWGVSADFRFLCDGGGSPVVDDVALSTSAASSSFSSITSDLQAQGYSATNTKYFVYFDANLGTLAGQGNLILDDQPGSANGNNRGPNWAVDYGYLDPGVWMHESGHTLGAVQLSAPDSSGALHCNDGLDVMCYADGGPSSAYNPGVCPDRIHYDCNANDYYNPYPAAGSYLANHWNVASSSFLTLKAAPRPGTRIHFAKLDGNTSGASAIAVDDSAIYIERNQGNGTFAAPTLAASNGAFYGSVGTYFGDLDGTGQASAIAVNASNTYIEANQGNDTFGAPALAAGSGPFYGSVGTYVGDIDGSGRVSLVAINPTSTYVEQNQGNRTFGPPRMASNNGPFYGAVGTYLADVDGSGRASLVAVNSTNTYVERNLGNGTFGPPTLLASNGPFYGTVLTDVVNLDGTKFDSVVAVNGVNTWIEHNSGGTFGSPTQAVSAGPFYGSLSTSLSDLDGTGKASLIAANADSIWVEHNAGNDTFGGPQLASVGFFSGTR